MKQDITKYVIECDICGRVKAYHMIFIALAYPCLEMGGYFHGLCCGFAPHGKGV